MKKILSLFKKSSKKSANHILNDAVIDRAVRLSIKDQRKMSERAAKIRAQQSGVR